jgi:hypothetical protein
MSGARHPTWPQRSRQPARRAPVVDERPERKAGLGQTTTKEGEHVSRVEGCPSLRNAPHRPIAAPAPLAWVRAQTSPDWVQNEVSSELEQVAVVFDSNRVKASLENVAVDPMDLVEPVGIRAVQPMHPAGKITSRCRNHEVVVVRHEAKRPQPPCPLLHQDGEESEKAKMVVVSREDGLAAVPASRYVVDPAARRNSRRPCHRLTVSVPAGRRITSSQFRS